jgi:hypothetical protein
MTEPTKIFIKGLASSDIVEMADGYVYYDALDGEVYFLNLTAAAILELCDGTTSAAQIANILQESFGLIEPPIDDVTTCLEGLASAGLVEGVDNNKLSLKKLFFLFSGKAYKG